MIKIAIEHGNWVISDVENNKSNVIHVFDHVKVNITNNFEVVAELVDSLTEVFGDEFQDWFKELITSYINSNYNSEILLDNCDKILDFSSRYIDGNDVDYSKFVDYSKKSSTSILFEEEDIRAIILSSTALKIYAVFWFDNILKLTDNVHRKVYSKLLSPCTDIETSTKIYQIIRSRTCRSSSTDKYMWDIIKLSLIETPEHYTMHVFNYLMNSLFASLDPNSNPVSFIVGVIDESIGWMLTTVYNNKILYGEVFGESDEIYGTQLHQNLVHIKCCNDTIGKAAKAAIDIVENNYGLDEDDFRNFRERLDYIIMLYPNMKRIIMPITSKVLGVPYSYLAKSPPVHIMLSGILMYECGRGLLDISFPILTEYLVCCPKNRLISSSKSSYKIKNLEFVINNKEKHLLYEKIFGIPQIDIKYKVMSSICGVLSACKRNMIYLVDGTPLPRFNYGDLENDVCKFFIELYSDQLDDVFEKMSKIADTYF